jgi:hypothetical protein
MVTALLGLAYPLFIDKINAIAKEYKSRRLSERFKKEHFYIVFNPLLILCIVEMFIIPFVLTAIQNEVWEILLLTIQGVSVFILSMCMVALYDLLLTYNDAELLFDRVRNSEGDEQKLTDIEELMRYAATDEEKRMLYYRCVEELSRLICEFQKKEKQRYDKQ